MHLCTSPWHFLLVDRVQNSGNWLTRNQGVLIHTGRVHYLYKYITLFHAAVKQKKYHRSVSLVSFVVSYCDHEVFKACVNPVYFRVHHCEIAYHAIDW